MKDICRKRNAVSKEDAQTLKLTRNEIKVLGLVNHVPQKLVDIVLISGLPHTTVYETLHSLRTRGLILCAGEGRARRWLKLQKDITHRGSKPKSSKDVQILEGREVMLSFISELFITHRGDRLLSFHGEKISEGWLSLLSKEEIEKRNIMIIDNNIIVERYVPEHGYKKIFKLLGESWQKTMIGRTHITYLLPDRFCNSKTEIFMFSDVVMIYETHLQRITVFREKETVTMYKAIFEMMRHCGRKIDSEATFKSYIDNK